MPRLHVIDGVIEIALRTASKRATRQDIALGLIAALRRIHGALYEVGGEAMVLAMRATLRDVIIGHNLDRLRQTKRVPDPVPLPDAGCGTADFATAVLEDAAHSCLAFNALTPDNQCVNLAIRRLMERLIETLGGAPDYGALVDRIADAIEMAGPGALARPPGSRPLMH